MDYYKKIARLRYSVNKVGAIQLFMFKIIRKTHNIYNVIRFKKNKSYYV